MLQYNLGCELDYSIFAPSSLVFNIAVTPQDNQTILHENIRINPPLKIEEYVTLAENTRYFRLNANPGKIRLSYQAKVGLSASYSTSRITAIDGEIPQEKISCSKEESYACFRLPESNISEIQLQYLPLELFSYLYPSRYCQSDLLLRFALTEFGEITPGYSRVKGICDWIYHNVLYLPGSTNALTSAYDTAIERVGVCRDFAHLGIALCRALNIPARFVTAYAYGLNPSDFHAVFEAYLDGGWYMFDPTRLVPLNSIVRVGTGRDAADVSFASIFGWAQMNEMRLFMELLDD